MSSSAMSRMKLRERHERTLTVIGHAHLVAVDCEQHLEALAGITIVVGEQDAQATVARRRGICRDRQRT